MNFTIRKVICFLVNILLLSSCIQKPPKDVIVDDVLPKLEIKAQHLSGEEKALDISEGAINYQQNDGYKLFYGTWEYKKVVSQHIRLGGDEGYNDLLGETLTYHPEYFKDSIGEIKNPTYLISICPIDTGSYNQFFAEQVGVEELLPNINFFVLIQVVNKPNKLDTRLYGFTFIIKNDTTMYAFDNNCIYELIRIGYMEDYSQDKESTFQERW